MHSTIDIDAIATNTASCDWVIDAQIIAQAQFDQYLKEHISCRCCMKIG